MHLAARAHVESGSVAPKRWLSMHPEHQPRGDPTDVGVEWAEIRPTLALNGKVDRAGEAVP